MEAVVLDRSPEIEAADQEVDGELARLCEYLEITISPADRERCVITPVAKGAGSGDAGSGGDRYQT